VWLPGTCLAALLTVFALTSVSQSGWAAGVVTNTTDSAVTGALAFQHVGTATCSAGPAASSTTTCSGTVVPASATSGAGAVTGTDLITDNGTVAAAKLTQTVQAPSCAPVQLANAKTTTAPMLARYSTAFQQTDKWGTTSAVGLSGSAYATGVSTFSSAAPVSLGVWFKVANGYSSGGGLITLDASASNALSGAPPVAVWMTSTGKISMYVKGNAATASTTTTAGVYNNGAWHLAVLSVPTGASVAPALYVDGTTSSGNSINAGTGGTGYWHLGWVDTTGLAGAPSSASLSGTLSGAFVTSSAVTSGNVTTLNAAASAAAYKTSVLALAGIQHLWTLDDSGTTTYTGTMPAGMAAPCGQVDIALSFTNPAASIAVQTLAAFANGSPTTVAAPGPGVTQTMTVSLTRHAGYSTDISGLRLYAPLTVTEKVSGSSTWSLSFTWTGAQAVFLA
jgi:hypothetical protein